MPESTEWIQKKRMMWVIMTRDRSLCILSRPHHRRPKVKLERRDEGGGPSEKRNSVTRLHDKDRVARRKPELLSLNDHARINRMDSEKRE
uniref:Uncharacterized protein n=1 Tax=Caenorhabditis tropicalis TaxID=1561998 RepID=A0A1I7TBS8_9PELO